MKSLINKDEASHRLDARNPSQVERYFLMIQLQTFELIFEHMFSKRASNSHALFSKKCDIPVALSFGDHHYLTHKNAGNFDTSIRVTSIRSHFL